MAANSQPIHLGFVGLSSKGWAAMMLAPPLFEQPLAPKYTLVAVSTTNPESAQASAEKYTQLGQANNKNPAVRAYHGSAEHITQDEDIDMVAVAIKPVYQKDAAMKVIEAGKDLFIEWPVGKNLSQTREICEAAKKQGIKTMVGCQARFTGFAIKIRSMLAAEELGKIYSSNLIVSFNRGWGPIVLDTFKHMASAANGATLLDVGGGHAVDILMHTLGPVASLSAVVTNHHSTTAVIDSTTMKPTGEKIPQDGQSQVCVSGILHTKVGKEAEVVQTPFSLHLQSGVKEGDFNWIIMCEKGTLRVQADTKLGFFDPSPVLYWNGEKVELGQKGDQRIALAWEAFADRRNSEYAEVDDALRTKEVLDAVVRSSKEGRRIDLL